MKTITQENLPKVVTATEPKMRAIDLDLDDFLTEFESTFTSLTSSTLSSKVRDEFLVEEEPESLPRRMTSQNSRTSSHKDNPEGEAQKKFGSAKGISSDQYFKDSAGDNSVSFFFPKKNI